MKILHTSDWHLGKRLNERERMAEQIEVMDEIVRIAGEERGMPTVCIKGYIRPYCLRRFPAWR